VVLLVALKKAVIGEMMVANGLTPQAVVAMVTIGVLRKATGVKMVNGLIRRPAGQLELVQQKLRRQ
jgi:hypothetical protein